MNILAIDLGSYSIKAAIVKASGGRLELLSQSNVPTAGIRVGKVTSMEKASSSIASVIEKVKENISINIDKTVVSINAAYLKSYKSRSRLMLDSGATITINDIQKALENARNQAVLSNGEVALHVLPWCFYASSSTAANNSTIVEDPLGMCASAFILDAHIISINQDDLNNIRRILELAGVSNYELVAGIYADAIYALHDDEKERSIAVISLGHETCQFAVYMQNSIVWLDFLPFGSGQISEDLVEILKIQEDTAKKLKIDHVHYKDSDNIEISCKDGNDGALNVGVIRKVIDSRIDQMLDVSHGFLCKSKDVNSFEYSNVVFTGGTFNAPQIKECAKPKFDNMAVRINQTAHPCFNPSDCQALNMPEYACLFGLCMYGAGFHTNYELNVNGILKTYQKSNPLAKLGDFGVSSSEPSDMVHPEINLKKSFDMERNLHDEPKEPIFSEEISLKIENTESQPSAMTKIKRFFTDKISGLF